jgi:hypothetical protein
MVGCLFVFYPKKKQQAGGKKTCLKQLNKKTLVNPYLREFNELMN